MKYTPHLDYAEECFRNSRTVEPERWRQNWEFAMWKHLFWAVESSEL